MISMRRSLAVVLRQFFLLRGSVARIMPLFVWVMVDMVLWGFMTKYLNRVSSPGFDFVPALLGAVLLWDFLIRVMQGVTIAFFEDVWSRNLLNLFASPLKVSEYIVGLVISSILTSTIGLIVMLVLATGVFGLSFFAYGLLFIPFLLVLFLCGIALGIFAIALVLRLGPSSEWFVWPIPALLSPLAGVFYPIAVLPHWMQLISRAMPTSYVFENMRALVTNGHASLHELALSIALSCAYVALAGWFFIRIYKRSVRTGVIARYSAESL
jgi:ABC-2 type transport system permease protein